MNIEPIATRRDVYYTNDGLTAQDIVHATRDTVLQLGRFKTLEGRIAQVQITNIAAQIYGAVTTFFCTDKTTDKAYFGSYDLSTERFTFKLMRPWRV